MTITAEPKPLREARSELKHFDTNRDLYERRDRVHHLTRLGLSEEEISLAIGLSDRGVARHRAKPPSPQRPRLYDGASVSDDRAADLEGGVELVLQLATILRDEDPALVWGSLIRLDRRKLQELAVIALAAIPVDQTRQQLYAWVSGLPAAQEEA